MSDAAAPISGERGSALLLRHCTTPVDPVERPPAYWRLEQLVGGELARLLVVALASRRGERLAA